MPYKDPEKRQAYQREYKRVQRAGSSQTPGQVPGLSSPSTDALGRRRSSGCTHRCRVHFGDCMSTYRELRQPYKTVRPLYLEPCRSIWALGADEEGGPPGL